MRWAFLFVIPVVLLLAGCGGEIVSPLPQTVVGTVQASTTPAPPKLPKGNAKAGATVFQSAGCGGCHTLKAAGSTGSVGPNLDQLAPPLARIETQVINGGGPMPPYKGQLSDQQIADVAQYVYSSTHGG